MATPSPSAESHTTAAAPADAFETLRVEPKFDLDPKVLAERHRTLSLALHPDRFAGRPSAERRLALEQAMQVNSAYRTLRDPVARAEALARRRGITLPGETVMHPELLERAMERRELLSEAVLAADDQKKVDLWRRAKEEQESEMARLTQLFAGSSPEAGPLGEILASLRFLRRFIEAAEAELEALPAEGASPAK